MTKLNNLANHAAAFAVLFLCGAQAMALTLPEANDVLAGNRFDPAHVAYPEVLVQDLRIRIQRGKDWPLHLLVSKSGLSEKQLTLPGIDEQVSKIGIHRDRLVVISAMGQENIADVVIFDLNSGQILDDFWAYDPAISPDGRAIAFVGFYTPHLIASYEDQEFIYDLDASPDENRPAFGDRERPRNQSDRQDEAGRPIFPLKKGELARRNVNGDEANYHHKNSPFAWSADSRHVAFVDEQHKEASIVIADVSSVLRQMHSPDVDVSTTDTSIAALPELADSCDVLGLSRFGPDRCAGFAYDFTRLIVGNDMSVKIHLATPGNEPVTRDITVDSRRFKPVPR